MTIVTIIIITTTIITIASTATTTVTAATTTTSTITTTNIRLDQLTVEIPEHTNTTVTKNNKTKHKIDNNTKSISHR